MPGGGTSGSVQSVNRALAALELAAASPRGVTAKEVAAHLGLALPSTYHLLATLIDAGYLLHVAGEHRYILGYRVRLLERGLERQMAVPSRVAEVVRLLHVEADAAAYYAVYREDDVVVAHVSDSDRRPRAVDVGFHESPHATALGKVMLAAMEPDVRGRYLRRRGLARCTHRTIVDPDELEAQLAQVRRSGIAQQDGELRPGLSCLAAPVWSASGTAVGSMAVSLPSAELQQRRWHLEGAVRRGALVASRALGP